MKKLVIILILISVTGIMPPTPAIANPVKTPGKTELGQVNQPKRKIVKKRKRTIKRRISARRRHRMNKQLRQANQHLKDEKKAQAAQSKVKTEQQPPN